MPSRPVINRPRLATMPPPPLSQADVIAYLSEQTLRDATAAGWLKPACRRPGKGGSVFYNPAHVMVVRERILAGEYPGGDQV